MQICMTYSRELYRNQHFVWTWLLYWNLLVLDWTSGFLNDLCPLRLGNLASFVRHLVCECQRVGSTKQKQSVQCAEKLLSFD